MRSLASGQLSCELSSQRCGSGDEALCHAAHLCCALSPLLRKRIGGCGCFPLGGSSIGSRLVSRGFSESGAAEGVRGTSRSSRCRELRRLQLQRRLLSSSGGGICSGILTRLNTRAKPFKLSSGGGASSLSLACSRCSDFCVAHSRIPLRSDGGECLLQFSAASSSSGQLLTKARHLCLSCVTLRAGHVRFCRQSGDGAVQASSVFSKASHAGLRCGAL